MMEEQTGKVWIEQGEQNQDRKEEKKTLFLYSRNVVDLFIR